MKSSGILSGLSGIIVVTLLFGCATTNGDWAEAKRQGTADAYNRFLARHPNAEQADDARRMRDEIYATDAWDTARAVNTIQYYQSFLKDYPKSSYEEQANRAIETIRFEHAKSRDSIFEYETFLDQYAEGSNAQAAKRRIRELRYSQAREQMTRTAYESFISNYSEGADVDSLKAELPTIMKIEKSVILARAIMQYRPRAFLGISDNGVSGMTMTQANLTPQDLTALEKMLSEGAHPNDVRIAGFEAAGEKKISTGMVMYSTGKPGHIVSAEKEGLTLLQYCRENQLEPIARLLKKYGAK